MFLLSLPIFTMQQIKKITDIAMRIPKIINLFLTLCSKFLVKNPSFLICIHQFLSPPVATDTAGGQQERKGKGEKSRKDIRFSVHRLTTFLCFVAEPQNTVRKCKNYSIL